MTKHFRKIHIYTALFFLPFGLLYAITGFLYLIDYKKISYKETYIVPYAANQSFSDVNNFETLEDVLKLKGIKHLSKKGRGNQIMATSIKADATLKRNDLQSYKIEISHKNLFAQAMSMHKGVGGVFIKASGIIFGLIMLIFFVSGLGAVAWGKREKFKTYGTVVLGFVALLLLYFLSV